MIKNSRAAVLIIGLTGALVLTACGEKEATPVIEDDQTGELSGEILERSVTDEMLPLDRAGGPGVAQTEPATVQTGAPRAYAGSDTEDTSDTDSDTE